MSDQKLTRSTWQWGAVAAVAVVGLAVFVVNQRPPNATPIASSAAIERYAALVLQAQKNFFATQKSYASTLEQLQLAPPTLGVTIDYRGSSPLGFCWLARSGSGVWYTISQTRVARSERAVAAPPPISCP